MKHVTVRGNVRRDNTGIFREIPVIMTEYGPLKPLVDYMLKRVLTHSNMWMVKLAQAVSLLLDYMEANQNCFDDSRELFETFAQRLYTGTIGDDGKDPSGLGWNGRSPVQARQMVMAISEFSDWMAENQNGQPVNPWRQATRGEEMLAWAAWHQKRHRAFLAHTWDRETSSLAMTRARNVLLKKTPVVDRGAVKFFPDSRMPDLLFRGFIVPRKQDSARVEERLNLRDILITMLMHYGGLRVSEPFHLYVQDVMPDPANGDRAYVRIFHPSLGTAPPDWPDINGKPTRCNRQAYLRGKYGLRPRDTYGNTDQMHAGWKGNALDHAMHFMDVNWFPQWSGELFMKLWVLYMARRPVDPGHPFAFISLDGGPYSIDAFVRQHRRAVERIGLIPAKMLGTTPHAHRHAYGQRLTDADIDPIYRKKALHHRSLESQVVYTEPDRAKLTRLLEEAATRAQSGARLAPPDFLGFGFQDVDPLGLMSGPNPKLRGSK